MTAPPRDATWREAHLVLILAIMRGRGAVHLPELYGVLRQHPHWADRDDNALRRLVVDELGVRIKQVRVVERGGRIGVHRDDVVPLLTGARIPPPPPGSPLAYVYTPGQRGGVHRVERWRRAGEWSDAIDRTPTTGPPTTRG